MLNPSETVAHVVLEHSECAEVFRRHRIDFCCKGEVSVANAARDRGVALEDLMRALQEAISARQGVSPAAVKDLGTAALVDHIVDKHHAYLRRVLPFVRSLAAKVARVHGDHNPKLRALDDSVATLFDVLLAHLDDEELSLFPALRADDARDRERVREELAGMREEHLGVAQLLADVRAAADDFSVPDWACNSYRSLFAELEAIERDTFTHVYLENHVLAPRFLESIPSSAAGVGTRVSLAEVAAELRASQAFRETGRSAKTLLKNNETRVVLMAMRKGAKMVEHKTDHSITVQAIEGNVQLNTARGTIELPSPDLLFLDAGVPHDVVAHEDSTVLVTINWRNETPR